MIFSNGFKDDSLIRDKVAADIFREAGVPSARGAFVRVYVDYGDGPTYFGIYTMIEDPSDEMLTTQFGDDTGNLYKPEGYGATWREFVESDFEKKTNEDEADWSDIIAAIEALNANPSDAAQWRSNLEAVFNVDAFLKCLAVNQTIVNWDSYGMMNHNYYVYSDPSDGGRIVWFPWDLNEAMLTEGPGNSSFATSIMLDSVDDEWPVIRYLLDDDVYRERYKAEVQAFLDGAFNVSDVQARISAYHALISPYVIGPEATEASPYTFIRNTQDFSNAVSGNGGLNQHIADRHEDATRALQND
jgi:spore coat protein CotH